MSARKVVRTWWELVDRHGRVCAKWSEREMIVNERAAHLDPTGLRIVKVTRYKGRGLTQADIDAAVSAERARIVNAIRTWARGKEPDNRSLDEVLRDLVKP